jgi:hypothetical protein
VVSPCPLAVSLLLASLIAPSLLVAVSVVASVFDQAPVVAGLAQAVATSTAKQSAGERTNFGMVEASSGAQTRKFLTGLRIAKLVR